MQPSEQVICEPGRALHLDAMLGLVQNQPQLPLVGDTAGRRARPAPDSDWRIDEPTRRVGRRGLAEARAALARASALEDTRADAA
jgi:hypothetical protein